MKDKSIVIKNIYYMLSYVFGALDQSDFRNVGTETFENIHNLFAAILSYGIGRQLKQGLYSEYCSRSDDIPVARGKINMLGTVKNRTKGRLRLQCEYDELTVNNIYNRILKTTANVLLRDAGVDSIYRAALKKELMLFSGVDEIAPEVICWSAIRFQRSNATYRMLIGVCRLVLDGMLLTTEDGETRLASFVSDRHMSELYEKFILNYYVREHPELKAASSRILWALDSDDGGMLPAMQSDVMLSRGNDVLIIDAKYYTHAMQRHYGKYTIHSGNMYQIFSYVKNKDAGFGDRAHTVSGMLLYAATDEHMQPNGSFLMSGNRISVMTLDLNCPFREIRIQLDDIIKKHFP